MRSFKANAMLAALLALACMGCGEKSEFVGHWERTNSGSNIQQPAGEAPWTLDINADKTFTLTMFNKESTGTWEATDDGIALTYVERHFVIGNSSGVTMHFGADKNTIVSAPDAVGWTNTFVRK